MKLLLDTRAVIWWFLDDPRLSDEARTAIATASNTVAVSAVSAWEIAIKQHLGKLAIPTNLENEIRRSRFLELPITVGDALLAGTLDLLHRDPFDRMLVAQSRRGGWTLVTRDTRIQSYGINTMLA